MNPTIVQTTLWNLNLELRLLGLIALVMSSAIYPLYIKSMLRGKITPPRSTWFLWLLLDAIILISQLARKNLDAMMVAYLGGTLVVAVLTIWYGEKGWTQTETACTIIVSAALGMWMILGPSIATVSALVGITVGLVPILEKVWKGAYEDRLVWTLAFAASIINAFDGQFLTGLWFASLQFCVLAIVVYHWGWWQTPLKTTET